MKMKTIIATALLLFACVRITVAQDKYDLAVVAYYRDVPNPLLLVSINGEKFEQIEVQKEELNGKTWGISMNPLITYVNKMQDQGWEVVGGLLTSGLPNQSMFYYSLRKKRK